MELTLMRSTLQIRVFVAEITDEFTLGLNILQARDASVDLRSHMLRMGREEVSLWCHGGRPPLFRLALVSDEVIPTGCDGELTADYMTR